jgi:transcriptional regulator with XRE-family HTH domain
VTGMEVGPHFARPKVGPYLRHCRKRAGLSQIELAELLADDHRKAENQRTQVSNWENGRYVPSGDTVLQILSLTGALADPPLEARSLWSVLLGLEEQLRRLNDRELEAR